MIRINLMRITLLLAILGLSSAQEGHRQLRANSDLRVLQEEEEAENYDDGNVEADESDDGNDYGYDDGGWMIVNQSQQDDLAMAEAEDEEAGGNIFISAVKSTAGDFYSRSPSEWTNSEWNVLLITFLIFSCTCCCLAGCAAYCCLVPSDDEDDDDCDLKDRTGCRRAKLVCKRRRVVVKPEDSPARTEVSQTGTEEIGDAKSVSTIGSGKSISSLEIEDDKEKPLLHQENVVRNVSLVKSFEQIVLPTKSRSQKSAPETRSAKAKTKAESGHYSRMQV